MPLVRYIGRKDRKTDNVAHTDAVWLGNGDVQEVTADAWEKLKAYPDVWELAELDEQPDSGAMTLADAPPKRGPGRPRKNSL